MSRPNSDFVANLFGRYTPALVKFFTRRVRNPADARDLTQDAYVRLLRVDKFDLIRNPQAYLFRIAANLVYEYRLKERGERVSIDSPSVTAELDEIAGLTLEDQADQAKRMTQLESVLATLAPQYRAAVILHRQEGYTYEEIAERIGVSIHTVKKYISVGLFQCRARLKIKGVKQP